MLSARLQHIYEMVPNCDVVADIGTDHGYLPIALVASEKVKKAYAMDINKGPLAKASENIGQAALVGKVITLQSNGLERLPTDADVVVIAGMGGMLIAQIIEQNKASLSQLKSMVLSPHQDEAALRRKVNALGWTIADERMVIDNDKFYTVMYCLPQVEHCEALDFVYGKHLLANQDPVWLQYMTKKVKKLKQIQNSLQNQVTDSSRERLKEIEKELKEINEVIHDEA